MSAQPGPAEEGVHNIKTNQEWKDVRDSGSVFIVDAFATWCGPCKAIAPILVNLSKEFEGVRFYKVDVDELPEVAQELGVRAMPTLFLFNNKEKVDSVTGANPAAIQAMVAKGSKFVA